MPDELRVPLYFEPTLGELLARADLEGDELTLAGATRRILVATAGELEAELRNIHPGWRARLRAALAEAGARLESGWRSSERQRELYNCWKAGTPGCNPANPPGTSNHEAEPYGPALALAADCHPDKNNPSRVDYLAMREVFARHGLHFPIASELWHAQPTEQAEGYYDAMPTFATPPASSRPTGDDEMVLT